MRIAFVVHDYNRHGGHARYTAELATRFKREHEVHVFANTFEEPDPDGITYHHVRAWRANALTTILSFILPATFAVRGKFDIVHAQGLCGLRQNVITAHFCQAAWFKALAQEDLSLSWRQKVFKWLVTGLERYALAKRSTRRVIAVSQRVKTDLAENYRRMDGVDVVYHGIDSVTFHPKNRETYRSSVRATAGIPDDRFVALYVGDLKKGAAAAIRATAKTPGVTLLILSGSEQTPYREIAKVEQVDDRVIFHPHSKQVHTFFAAADAFVFPTVYDPYGLVLGEAMATGLPVITSFMAGAAELIQHGVNGLLTNRSWDVEAISGHLATLRDDRELRERIGAAARATIEQYTWDRTAEQTMAVYREVLAEKRR